MLFQSSSSQTFHVCYVIHFRIVTYLISLMSIFKLMRPCRNSQECACTESMRNCEPLLTILVTVCDLYVFIWERLVTWRTINAFIKEFYLFSL